MRRFIGVVALSVAVFSTGVVLAAEAQTQGNTPTTPAASATKKTLHQTRTQTHKPKTAKAKTPRPAKPPKKAGETVTSTTPAMPSAQPKQ